MAVVIMIGHNRVFNIIIFMADKCSLILYFKNIGQYFGETSRLLKYRIKEHVSAIKDNDIKI